MVSSGQRTESAFIPGRWPACGAHPGKRQRHSGALPGGGSGQVHRRRPRGLGVVPLKPSILYRIASVLLLLFAALHGFGFQQVDPAWGVDSLIGSMRSVHFDLMGSSRTYWDLFVGFGLFLSVFLVFTAVLTWQLREIIVVQLASVIGHRGKARHHFTDPGAIDIGMAQASA